MCGSARRGIVRPTWDKTWMDVAAIIGQRSLCDLAKVGAVIVTRDNRVASAGYNGPAPGLRIRQDCHVWCPRGSSPGSGSACMALHAEANALMRADWTEIQGGTIYSSAATCENCAKLVAGSGIARLVHCVLNERDRARDPGKVEKYLALCNVRTERITQWDG